LCLVRTVVPARSAQGNAVLVNKQARRTAGAAWASSGNALSLQALIGDPHLLKVLAVLLLGAEAILKRGSVQSGVHPETHFARLTSRTSTSAIAVPMA
jgi:hypothetical protein